LPDPQQAPQQARYHCVRALRMPLLLVAAFFLVCESAWMVALAPTDIIRYQCDAVAFWQGSHGVRSLATGQCAFLHISTPQPAFHLTPQEYPPLALLPFSAPLLAPRADYALTFALMMTLVAGLVAWLLSRFHSRQATLRFLLYLALGAGALFQTRYDLIPAAGMLTCLIAAERKRWSVAYIALALAVLLKLYPLVALPAVFIAERQDRAERAQTSAAAPALRQRWWWNIAWFGVVTLGAQSCLAVFGLADAIVQPIAYLLQRPTQVESLQSSFAWLAHAAGAPLTVVFTYGSLNSVSPLANGLTWVGLGCCCAGCLAVCWLQWQRRLSLGQAMIALLCILIVTGKVFSPQYLIWLIPLIAYVGAARWWLWWWVGILCLTLGVYVAYYSHLPDPATAARILPTLPGFFAVVAVRNAALLFITIAYLINWRHARHANTTTISRRGSGFDRRIPRGVYFKYGGKLAHTAMCRARFATTLAEQGDAQCRKKTRSQTSVP